MVHPRCQLCGRKLHQVKVQNHYSFNLGVVLRDFYIWKCGRHGEISVLPSTEQLSFEEAKREKWRSLMHKILGD